MSEYHHHLADLGKLLQASTNKHSAEQLCIHWSVVFVCHYWDVVLTMHLPYEIHVQLTMDVLNSLD